jgi:biotin synthase
MNKKLLVCRSTNQMLKADKLINIIGITVEMVPTPKRVGEICTTALRFDGIHLNLIEDLLAENNLDYQGIYEDTPYVFPNLMKENQEKLFPEEFKKILGKISRGKDLSRNNIIYLLKINDKQILEKLYLVANFIRQEVIGDIVDIRGAIEFSNYCTESCMYCGLRKENLNLARYRMTIEEILASAKEIKELGLKTIILQSGEDPWYTLDRLLEIVSGIKEKYGLRITLSIGERPIEEYQKLKTAGANNFLLKIENCNPELYHKFHPTSSYENRLNSIRALKKMGYIIGSGNIIGLPGQSIEDLADDIIFYREEGIHMIGIGPFIPAQNTPLCNETLGDVDLTLKSIAISRIVCKNSFIPATTALATINPLYQQRALEVGANTIMIINTPEKYQKLYHIYRDKMAVDLDGTLKIVDKLGRKRPAYLA